VLSGSSCEFAAAAPAAAAAPGLTFVVDVVVTWTVVVDSESADDGLVTVTVDGGVVTVVVSAGGAVTVVVSAGAAGAVIVVVTAVLAGRVVVDGLVVEVLVVGVVTEDRDGIVGAVALTESVGDAVPPPPPQPATRPATNSVRNAPHPRRRRSPRRMRSDTSSIVEAVPDLRDAWTRRG